MKSMWLKYKTKWSKKRSENSLL